MSFSTALTGLHAAQAEIAATSNNIANIGTTGFKRSTAEFGDIFSSSPSQSSKFTIGTGTLLKSVKQEFSQGNIATSGSTLDIAVTGQGFFTLKPSLTSTQTIFSRAGSFTINSDLYVVDSQSQHLQVYPVNSDGSIVATGIESAKSLQLPATSGIPKATESIDMVVNLPADAKVLNTPFNRLDPTTFNQSSSLTVYDSLGNPSIATVYYVKTQTAGAEAPANKWQTYVYVGDTQFTPQIAKATNSQGEAYYINEFGQVAPKSKIDPFSIAEAGPLYRQDQQTLPLAHPISSQPATFLGVQSLFSSDMQTVHVVTDPALYSATRESDPINNADSSYFWGVDMFTVEVNGSKPQSISLKAGDYTATQLADALTLAINEKFDNPVSFTIFDTFRKDGSTLRPGNDIIQIDLLKSSPDGSVPLDVPIEIDLFGSAGASGTPSPVPSGSAQMDLSRDELVHLAQSKLNEALNKRRLDFQMAASWPDPANPPIKVGYDVSTRSLTFEVDPLQLGEYSTFKVFNPNDTTNSLGIPSRTKSAEVDILAGVRWIGGEALGASPSSDLQNHPTGIVVSYDETANKFKIASGATGKYYLDVDQFGQSVEKPSYIKIGRSSLASSAQPQVDSYILPDGFFDSDHTIAFDVDGRVLNYSFQTPGSMDPSVNATAFFDGLAQAAPVYFHQEKAAVLSSTETPANALKVSGKPMNGDEFLLSIVPTIGGNQIDLSVGPLVIDPNDTPEMRLAELRDKINAQLPSPLTCTMNVEAYQLQFPWTSVGLPVSMKQTKRGSDNANLAAIDYADSTVLSSPATIVRGTSSTPTKQTVSLTSLNGGDPDVQVGDVYRIKIPKADGSVVSKDIEVPNNALLDVPVLDDDGVEVAKVDFNLHPDGSFTVEATWSANGSFLGAMSIEQLKVAGVQVRPPDVGSLWISHTGNNLTVAGAPTGEPQRLKTRIDGTLVNKDGLSSIDGYPFQSAAGTPGFNGGNSLLGITATTNGQKFFGSGLRSTAATAVGTRAITLMNMNFTPDISRKENEFQVSVDGVTAKIVLPFGSYNGGTMAKALQDRMNQIEDPVTGRKISGVSVQYDETNNRLVFTSGTVGPESQIMVLGSANFGLRNVTTTGGSTPKWTPLTQATKDGVPLYVDENGVILDHGSPPDVTKWYPIYLDEGELTFDGFGKIVSPLASTIYRPVLPDGESAAPGSMSPTLNIGFGKTSTQFSSAFSVLSLSQDGYTSGSMSGLDIDASGTVRVTYSNGQTKALGKIMLATFANMNGLQQIGNADYLTTAASGEPRLGQAGLGGFGVIKSGALEQSNVDVTDELVKLITSQRNFQASAKMIDTQKQLTETLIGIR